MHGAGDIAIAHGLVERHHQHLLGLVAVVLDQRRADRIDADAVQRWQLDLGVERFGGALATQRAGHALVDFEFQLSAVLRQRQRRRMHPGLEPALVVDEGRLRRGHDPAGAVGIGERDAFFQRRGVDRVRGLQRVHRFLEVGILGILVELGAGQFQLESRAAEVEAVLGQCHALGDRLARIDVDGVAGPDRPVLGRREHQRVVVGPLPGAGLRRRQRDAGRCLADGLERRGGG